MSNNINELRRLAQAATPGPWVATTVVTSSGVCHKVGPFPGKTTEHPPRHACLYVDYESADNPADREIYANASFIAAANPATITELLDRLEAAEKSDAESLAMYRKARDERDALRAAVRHEADCVEACKSEIERLRAKLEKMERQEPVRLVAAVAYRWRYRGAVKWQYGELTEENVRAAEEHNHEVQALGILPGAQNVPKEAIAKILTEVMNIAVANGADSRSMPDEYVEVAAWLCGMPAQPAPSVPDATALLRRAAMAMEVVGTEWRESDPTLRLDLASALAQFIREVDGSHKLGAAALAEKIVGWIGEMKHHAGY